ncbi:MAG: S41 family peptidase [Firmicutes bacterium]|nr:S41 family peptidase [Bacillota bacterium]
MKKIISIFILSFILVACITDNDLINIEDAVYDIDFLVQTLEENFPFIGVAERITGIDNPLNELQNSLTAHAQPRMRLTSAQFENLIYDAFDNFFWGLAHLDLNPEYYFHLSYTETSTYAQIPSSGFEFNFPISSTPQIIEENKIALIPMDPAFFNNVDVVFPNMQELQDFIIKIQGFEHVIIDLRHINGGWMHSSINIFISPNISEQIVFQEFAFITNRMLAQNLYNEFVSEKSRWGNNLIRVATNVPLAPAREFAQNNNLVNINEDDLENLAYAFIMETVINPTNSASKRSLIADNIWLLIGDYNFSAATIFAKMAREAGFTLVGQQANNRNSDGRAYLTLPRTNHVISMDTFYITDNTGRNTEEFPIEPHYFNRPGMDALQTTLAIIAERTENQ